MSTEMERQVKRHAQHSRCVCDSLTMKEYLSNATSVIGSGILLLLPVQSRDLVCIGFEEAWVLLLLKACNRTWTMTIKSWSKLNLCRSLYLECLQVQSWQAGVLSPVLSTKGCFCCCVPRLPPGNHAVMVVASRWPLGVATRMWEVPSKRLGRFQKLSMFVCPKTTGRSEDILLVVPTTGRCQLCQSMAIEWWLAFRALPF